jgi:RNA polymerase sigma-70 factor (ECF subfamily)
MNESAKNSDSLLVERIRSGDAHAWQDFISRYEGRLLAFVESRLGRRSTSEDIVQEAFIGFLTSLPYYDGKRSLESYLFSICAHKLTDFLRREGRRPAIPISTLGTDSAGTWDASGGYSRASSVARQGERERMEEAALVDALKAQVAHWRSRGDWTKIECMELLFVRGRSNKAVSEMLGITEQQVANYKFDFLEKMRNAMRRSGLSRDIFPELYHE